ncbi:uncharacterized protein [Rutidosis leptorrhynchoides]|uniref:uncharacterized protein n=1 Tax=Rutidosis leptorrhynchoides TaxID=125765 RepID=UPI003A995D53
MKGDVCDVNRLDSDVLLPPRKRLLAGLKKQNSDIIGNSNGSSNSQSPSSCSSLNELDSRISYLLKAHLSNDNPSQEEIVAASKAAAEVAVKVATSARAAAQEKAIIAAKAMAAAKKALELVASIDDEDHHQDSLVSAEQQLKKNKSKKQVELQMLYTGKKPMLENGKVDDEDLARKLHQSINSSPRISKTVVEPSDVKTPEHKKLKTSVISENGIISPSSNHEGENITKENGPKVKAGDDDVTTSGRKRGRMKQKKLPLSICHDRDQAIIKEDGTLKSPLSVGPASSSVVDKSSLWKCQSFKAHACVKQNKVMQS